MDDYNFFDSDENEDIEDIIDEEDKNSYLSEPKKGFELIVKLLPNKNVRDKIFYQLDYKLDTQILSSLKELGNNTLSLSMRLTKLRNKIMEYKKVKLLMGRTIIGLGGQFSAGKSSFINSLLNDDKIMLPENQTPTTSIPTYIANGKVDSIKAYSNGNYLPLDNEAMQAMTHEFYEKYKIGFSRFVDNIMINTPNFPINLKEKVIFLDTPGYNKVDVNTRESLSDKYLAEQHLKNIDCLIWLVSIDQGTVQEDDIEFIKKISSSNIPVLLVFNKADKIPESICKNIIEENRQLLKDKNITVFGVTAYSSREKKEYSGDNLVSKFLDFTAMYSDKKQDVKTELENLIESIKEDFKKAIDEAKDKQYKLGNEISSANDIMFIKSLAHIYSSFSQNKFRLQIDENKFTKSAKEICELFDFIDKK